MTPDVVDEVRGAREMEIIGSAYRTMARKGSHRISLREVADEAGVSKALVLYHFGSKDRLLFEAMRWALVRTEERIRGGLETTKGPEDRIGALMDAIWIDAEANREFYLFYLDLIEHAGRAPGFETLSTMVDEIVNGLFAEVIAQGMAEGEFTVGDVGLAARHMRALVEGTFIQWIQTDGWRAEHQAWKAECGRALLRLLGCPP